MKNTFGVRKLWRVFNEEVKRVSSHLNDIKEIDDYGGKLLSSVSNVNYYYAQKY